MSYRYLPDYINGDFDSITADVSNFYKEKVGYKILREGVLTVTRLKLLVVNWLTATPKRQNKSDYCQHQRSLKKQSTFRDAAHWYRGNSGGVA